MTEKEIEKIRELFTELFREQMATRPSVFRQLWDWAKPNLPVAICCVIICVLLVMCVSLALRLDQGQTPPTPVPIPAPPEPTPPPITLEQLIMSEPEARRTASAMSIVETDIRNHAIRDTQTASEALRTELPTNVRDPVVETVEKHSDGTIEQYPDAMRETRRRIILRR